MILRFICMVVGLTLVSTGLFAAGIEESIHKIREKHEQLKRPVDLFLDKEYSRAADGFKAVLQGFELEGNQGMQAMASAGVGHSMLHLGKVDSALFYYEKAYILAKGVEPDLAGNMATAVGEIHGLRGNYEVAIEYYKEYSDYVFEIGDPYFYPSSLRLIGQYFDQLEEADSARVYLDKALALYELSGDKRGLSNTYSSLALHHERLAEYDKAVAYYLSQLETGGIENEANRAIGHLNLANVFTKINDWEKAEVYAVKALAICNQLDENYYKGTTTAHVLNTLARIAEKRGQDQKALKYYQKALAQYQKTKRTPKVITTLRNLGNHYEKLVQFEKADSCYLTAVKLAKNNQDSKSEVNKCLLALGVLRFKQGRLKESLSLLEEVATELKELNEPVLAQRTYFWLSRCYEETGRVREALGSLRKSGELKDSIYLIEQQRVIHEKEAKYERANKEKEIERLHFQNELHQTAIIQSNRQRFFLVMSVLLIGGIAVSSLFLYRNKRKSNRQLAEKNQIISQALSEKETLLKEIHHRVKNNLQVISSLLNLQSKYVKDPAALNALQEGRNRVKSMALIHQNLYQDAGLVGVNAQEYIEKLTESLIQSYQIDNDQIILEREVEPLKLDVDTIIPLGLIINELISNAFKYAFAGKKKGKIRVQLKSLDNGLSLKVADDGIGLPVKFNLGQSNSLGYRLIEAFVKKLKASIEFNRSAGTSVSIIVPEY